MNNKLTLITLTILLVQLFSCVTGDRSISGGPKDETPPTLKKIERKHKYLEITFDENVQITDANQIVSNIKEDINYKAILNKIRIYGLPLNTKKQIIYFNESIRDLNENNTLENYIFASNVGSDTFNLEGKISMPLQGSSKFENCYVLLVPEDYKEDQLSNLYNYNFNKSDKEGHFHLEYIPDPQGMKLFSYIDNNNNTIPDSGDFIGELYSTVDSTRENTIYISYFGNNLIYKDSLPNGIIKKVYQNSLLETINTPMEEMNKYMVLKDTIFNYSGYKDSLILSSNDLYEDRGIQILSSYPYLLKFSHSGVKQNGKYIELTSTIEQDTFSYIINGIDTLSLINLNKYQDKSSLSFIYDTIFNSSSKTNLILYVETDNHKVVYNGKINSKSKLELNPGKYNYFIYNDLNKNQLFDYYSLFLKYKGDQVIQPLKSIDIIEKIDVEINISL